MKKLIIIALGMGLALGTVSFAQDATKMDDTKTAKKAKKTKKTKKTDAKPADAPKM